jgi:hypothetical protein
MGAVAAAQSALSMQYAKTLLSTSSAPDAGELAGNMTANCGVGGGDFSVACVAIGTTAVNIHVTGVSTSVKDANAGGTFTLP